MNFTQDFFLITPIPKPVTEAGLVQIGNIPRRGIVRYIGEGIPGETMIVKPGDEVIYNELNDRDFPTDEYPDGIISCQRNCEMIVNRMIPLNNNVLIQLIEKDMSKLKTGLYIDITYDNHAHAVRYGEVIELPDQLICGVLENRNTIPWGTTMELRKHDTVIFDSNAFFMATQYQNYIDIDGQRLILINYQQIFVAVRKVEETGDFHKTDWKSSSEGELTRNYEKIIPLNGNILIESEPEKIETDLILPDIAKKPSKKYGIVRHIGSLNTDYWLGKLHLPGDQGVFNPGDRIVFQANANIKLEDDLHRILDKPYFRCQRRFVLGKFISENAQD